MPRKETIFFIFKKYFYALVLGVKLNMVICGFTMDELNWMKPQVGIWGAEFYNG